MTPETFISESPCEMARLKAIVRAWFHRVLFAMHAKNLLSEAATEGEGGVALPWPRETLRD